MYLLPKNNETANTIAQIKRRSCFCSQLKSCLTAEMTCVSVAKFPPLKLRSQILYSTIQNTGIVFFIRHNQVAHFVQQSSHQTCFVAMIHMCFFYSRQR